MGGGGHFPSDFLAVEKGAPVSTKKECQKRRKMVFSFGIWLGAENKQLKREHMFQFQFQFPCMVRNGLN
jgi:hypothetical protein